MLKIFKDSFLVCKETRLKILNYRQVQLTFESTDNAHLCKNEKSKNEVRYYYLRALLCNDLLITNKRENISFMSFSWEAIRVPELLVVTCIPK